MIFGCNDDKEYIPFYQDAIYIMDADGGNKQKVIDMDACINVQFIPASNKLLYTINTSDGTNTASIYTIDTDGSDTRLISGEFKVKRDLPSISEDGGKIVFWAFTESRDYIYDLYMTDSIGSEIINLTQTMDQSEKDASFIKYQDQEYLLYVTYFSENDSYYSTINTMNMNTFEVDTLYIEEIENDHGFKKPIYDTENDILFTIFDFYSVLKYNSLANGDSTFISYCAVNNMELSILHTQLLFQLNGIMLYNYDMNHFEELVDGYKFDIFEETIIYCTYFQSNTGDIFSIKIDGSDKTKLCENGFYPRFSEDGSMIVYIGSYIQNQERYLITN